MNTKLMLLLQFPKSHKRDNIDTLYLWILEEHICLISTHDMIYGPMLSEN